MAGERGKRIYRKTTDEEHARHDKAAKWRQAMLAARATPMILDISDDVADRLDAFSRTAGDADVKFFFELHDQFDGIKRISPQV